VGAGLQQRQNDQQDAAEGRASARAPRVPLSARQVDLYRGRKFNYDTLAQRLRELAFLNKGLEIHLTASAPHRDTKTGVESKHKEFKYIGGIASHQALNKGKRCCCTTSRIYMEGGA